MRKKVEMIGKKFGRLTVVEEVGKTDRGSYKYKCICDCGKTIVVNGWDVRCGNTKSCGCLNKEKSTERIKSTIINHSNIPAMLSKKLSKANTSGIRGVSPCKGKWRASIGVKGKFIWLGDYDKISDAERARIEAEEKYWAPIFAELEKES